MKKYQDLKNLFSKYEIDLHIRNIIKDNEKIINDIENYFMNGIKKNKYS